MEKKLLRSQENILLKTGPAFLGTGVNGFVDKSSILIKGGKFEQIYAGRAPHDSNLDIHQEIDLENYYVVPGLIDLHVHLCMSGEADFARKILETPDYETMKAYSNAKKALNAGFTTLRDAGSSGYQVVALRDSISNGLVEGPRIFAAGKILTETGGHADTPFLRGRICDGKDEVRKAVREQVKNGVDFIKITCSGGGMSPQDNPKHSQFSPEEISAAVVEAHSKDRKVAAHAQSNTGIRNSVISGIDTIEHALYLDREACDLIIERGCTIVPTMISPVMTAKNGRGNGVPDWAIEKTDIAIDAHKVSVTLAHDLGVKIGFGTDAGTPFNYHGSNANEFEMLVDSGGLTPEEALYSATGIAAEALDKKDILGTITKGAFADLVVVKGDPSSDIRCLKSPENIKLVIKEGKIIKNEL